MHSTYYLSNFPQYFDFTLLPCFFLADTDADTESESEVTGDSIPPNRVLSSGELEERRRAEKPSLDKAIDLTGMLDSSDESDVDKTLCATPILISGKNKK
jgi:hypothetical protein